MVILATKNNQTRVVVVPLFALDADRFGERAFGFQMRQQKCL
jgi:hypothetical protein